METNEELIKAWIGEKNQEQHYQKVMNGGFNWTTWLIPDLHMATRKMYLEVFIYIFITIAYSFIVTLMGIPENVINLLNCIIRIIMGFSFYPLYKRHIFRKIRKYEQQGLSYEEQLSIAQKNGGDKITGKTIAVIVFSIIEAIILYFGVANGLEIWSQLGNPNYDYNITESEDGINVWSIDGNQISYDSNKWKITQMNGYTALQYKDSMGYVTYSGKKDSNDDIDSFDDIEVRNYFETEMKKTLKQDNLTFRDIEYNKINSELLEIEVSFSRDNSNGKICLYADDTVMVSFTLIYENSNYEFENEAQEILRTIKFENENSVIESNNDIEEEFSNQSNSNSSKGVIGDLSFVLPDRYKASEYNTESYLRYNNDEILTSINVSSTPSDYYESTEEFVEHNVFRIESVDDFESENINGIKWIKYEIKNTYGREYYYITKYKDKYYLVEFEIIDEEYENNAIKHLEILKNSFELQ